jgi:carnitine O-acetyltransferase
LGYLQFRDSVVVNVSYFFHFKDDPTVDTTVGSRANIQRAAAMLFATGEFRKLVASGQLPAEKVGKQQTPLCSTAYKYMFHACRIPRPEQDSYRIYDPSRCTHAIVARKGHFFSVEIVDDKSGDPLPLHVLEDQLTQCVDLADSIPSSSRPKLGLLTASNRDNWSDAREELMRAGGVEMEEALETLESGAMVVNLDDEAPVSRQECGELFLTGGLNSGENRWFDKSIQLLVANNGKGALLGEHSMMDGMPLVNYANYVTNATYADVKKRSSGTSMEVPKVKDIFGSVTEKIDQSLLTDLENKGRSLVVALFENH